MSVIDNITESYGVEWEETSAESNYYIPEKYQLGILTTYLERQGMEFVTEGRVFCYPIDVLALQRDTTLSIELKSKNVSRGIEQAERNLDFVDYSFLSLWEEDITKSTIKKVDKSQIGLIGIGNGVRFHSPPKKSTQQLCRRGSIIESITPDVRDNASVQQQQ